MTEFLILLLMQVTIFSSITALIIIAVKQIFKCRIPPGLGMVMWIVLLARLICPIFPESRVSVYNFIPVGREIMYSLTNEVGDEIIARDEEKTQAENPYVIVGADTQLEKEPEAKAERQKNGGAKNSDSPVTIGEYIVNDAGEEADQKAALLNSAILAVYIAGIAVCLCVNVLAYRHAKKRALSKSVLCEDEKILDVYIKTARKLGINEDKLPPLRIGAASMLVGCVSPSVIYRDGMDEKEASFVLAHELSHYRHGDNPILLISTFIVCFFWYNPLIWVVRKMLREDIEVLCDSRTIDYFDLSSSEYAMVICRHSLYSEIQSEAGCSMSATGRSLKNRLRTISHNKNNKFLPKAASFLLCAVIIAVCLTNPITSQNSDFSAYIENFAEVSGANERVLQLSYGTTVSAYLGNIGTLLEEKFSPEYKLKIGNGSLEKFKRIVSELGCVDGETASEVQRLITDEVLTYRSCALINDCVASILTDGVSAEKSLTLLPEYITVGDMEVLLENLTEAEGEAVLKWYNKGVSGAEVELDRFYTSAMMELILERINNEWYQEKFSGFYSEIEYDVFKSRYYSDEIMNVTELLESNSTFYVLDPKITPVEKATLRHILGAATAGQREDVYYLKKCEDGCSADIAELLFRRGGYTVEKMLDGYAKVGETSYCYLSAENCAVLSREEISRIEKRLEGSPYVFSDCFEPIVYDNGAASGYYQLMQTEEIDEIFVFLNRIAYVTVRDDAPEIVGAASGGVRKAVLEAYSFGLIDAHDAKINPSEKISFGESLYYAYKLISSAVNLY